MVDKTVSTRNVAMKQSHTVAICQATIDDRENIDDKSYRT